MGAFTADFPKEKAALAYLVSGKRNFLIFFCLQLLSFMANIETDNLIPKYTELLTFSSKPADFKPGDEQRSVPRYGALLTCSGKACRASMKHDVAAPFFYCHI
jgi:hypothetical protein